MQRARWQLPGLVLLMAVVVAPTVVLALLGIASLKKAQAAFERDVSEAYARTATAIVAQSTSGINAEVDRIEPAVRAFSRTLTPDNRLALARSLGASPADLGIVVVDSRRKVLYPARPELLERAGSAARDAALETAEDAEARDGAGAAIALYEKLLVDSSGDTSPVKRALSGLGRCLSSTGHIEDALAAYERLAAMKGDDVDLCLPLLACLRIWQIKPSGETRLALLQACFDAALTAPMGQIRYYLRLLGTGEGDNTLADRTVEAMVARSDDERAAEVARSLSLQGAFSSGRMWQPVAKQPDAYSAMGGKDGLANPWPLACSFALESSADESRAAVIFVDATLFEDRVIRPLLTPVSQGAAVEFTLARGDATLPTSPEAAGGPPASVVARQRFPEPFGFWSILAVSRGKAADQLARSRIALMAWAIVLAGAAGIAAVLVLFVWASRRAHLARLQTDFVANVTHELKTPLTGIRSLAETMELNRVTSSEKRAEFLSAIVREADRLGRLINNVLDFARLQRGGPRLKLEKTNLSQLVTDVVASFEASLPSDDCQSIRVRVPAEPLFARVDEDLVTRALWNLLDNACKYSAPPRDIEVSLSEVAGTAVLSVKDNGIGLTPRQMRKIWRKFYRVDTSLSAGTQGAGLGLSLVKAYAESHSGSVSVRSEPGKGSVFSIVLPIGHGGDA